jgi:hypothetical protein
VIIVVTEHIAVEASVVKESCIVVSVIGNVTDVKHTHAAVMPRKELREPSLVNEGKR